MSILGALAGPLLGRVLGRNAGGDKPPQAPQVPYSELDIPTFQSYAGPIQDPLQRINLAEAMRDLGYETSYGAPSDQISSLEQRLAGIGSAGGALDTILPGADPFSPLNRNHQQAITQYLRDNQYFGLQGRDLLQLQQRLGMLNLPGGNNTVGGAMDLLNEYVQRGYSKDRAGVQGEIDALRGLSDTPTFSRIAGYDPKAELESQITAGAGTIRDLYSLEQDRQAERLRGDAARRGLYGSGQMARNQRELGARTADVTNRAVMDYGMQMRQQAERERQARLARAFGLMAGERSQQAQAYGAEAGARAQAGQYARGNYADQLAGYNTNVARRERGMNEMAGVSNMIGGLFGGGGSSGSNGSSSNGSSSGGGGFDMSRFMPFDKPA